MSAVATSPRPLRSHYPGFAATPKLVGTGPRHSRDLSFEQARDALGRMLDGRVSPTQAGAFLVATRIKGESAQELAGYTQALRDRVAQRDAPGPDPSIGRALVACAGGYDGVAARPHLSLAAAIVAAACGAEVILHCGPPLGPKYGVTPLSSAS